MYEKYMKLISNSISPSPESFLGNKVIGSRTCYLVAGEKTGKFFPLTEQRPDHFPIAQANSGPSPAREDRGKDLVSS